LQDLWLEPSRCYKIREVRLLISFVTTCIRIFYSIHLLHNAINFYPYFFVDSNSFINICYLWIFFSRSTIDLTENNNWLNCMNGPRTHSVVRLENSPRTHSLVCQWIRRKLGSISKGFMSCWATLRLCWDEIWFKTVIVDFLLNISYVNLVFEFMPNLFNEWHTLKIDSWSKSSNWIK